MLDIRKLYRPLQAHLLRLDLRELLRLVWVAQARTDDSGVWDVRTSTGSLGSVFYWELMVLSREALLNSIPVRRQRQRPTTTDLLKLVNRIRSIEESISRQTIASGDDAMKAMHPLVHQQAKWQNPREWDRMYRAFRIYNNSEVRPYLERAIGMRLSAAWTLGLAITGGANRSDVVSSRDDYSVLGVSAEEQQKFFRLVGAHRGRIKRRLEISRRTDAAWARSWNALGATPLVRLHAERPWEYLCPMPKLLLSRLSEGLFYDLVQSKESFGEAYGHAFESYVGEVLHAQFAASTHEIFGERPYMVGKKQKHGADWVVGDGTGHIMFECKTRRMRLNAKISPDSEDLEESLEDLADAVVQHYRNIMDAKQGRSHWIPDKLPIYPVVLTYEDWRLFSPHVVHSLHRLVDHRLRRLDLSDLMQELPFVVSSIADFETAGQAIAEIGIAKFFSARVRTPYRHFSLTDVAAQSFPEVRIGYKRLFPKSDQEMWGHLSHLFPLPSSVMNG